jgi:hypothetical protein
MITEEQALTLIRQYVKDSQDEKRRGDASAVVQLLQDRASALATLEKHFDTFTGQDRFWLYPLAGLVLESADARARFYDARLQREDDRVCIKLIQARQRVAR